jgi:hypothetical protein
VRGSPTTALLTACLLLAAATACTARTDEACLVCGGQPAGETATVTYRGLDYTVHREPCLAQWHAAREAGRLDAIVQRVEPRAALFQGDSKYLNPEFQGECPLCAYWLWAGLWVLSAVLSGGIAAAMAIPAHRSGPRAFALGLALPVLGVLLARRLPARGDEFPLRGSKIPRTRGQAVCDGCGRGVHPSADRCPGCGATLTPRVRSEVSAVRSAGGGAEG